MPRRLLCLILGVLAFAWPPDPAPAQSCSLETRCDAAKSRWKPKGKLSWTLDYGNAFADGPPDLDAHEAYVVPLPVVERAEALRGGATELKCTAGKKLLCYTNCGAYENGHWNEAIIDPVRSELIGARMAGYPNENWLDIRRLDVMRSLIRDKFAKAARLGCDAIMCDNVEAWTTGTDGEDGKALRIYRERGRKALKAFASRTVKERTGFQISYEDQIAFNRMLAEEAHGQCMAIGLYNDVFQLRELARHFDFALNEQCHHCGWCDLYKPFVKSGKPVLHLEYRDNEGFCKPGDAPIGRICSDLKAQRLTTFSTIKREASSKLHLPDTPEMCR